jgi:hypothetical protein
VSFTDAAGALFARASTDACPEDLVLQVGEARQPLTLGGFREHLERILGRTLPATV